MFKELTKELNVQDNRGTSDPIFMVEEKVRIFGLDSGYSDDHIWLYDGEEVEDEEVLEELNRDPWDSDPYEQVYYQDIWQVVQPFFTEKAAQQFIDSNKHKLNEPRIYVSSGYNNPEWKSVRNYLKELG